MSKFVTDKYLWQGRLIIFFYLKKAVADNYWVLVEVYGEHASIQKTCERWFKCIKSGNFDVQDKERPGQPKDFNFSDWEALFKR